MGEKVFKPKPEYSNCCYKLIEIIYRLPTNETIKKANKKKSYSWRVYVLG